jgi:hypothetical protein
MAGDRAYRWGWHPDRPQDARRRTGGGGDDVPVPGARDGWVSTADFAALVGGERVSVSVASVAQVCREGGLRARKQGGRWMIDAEEAERLATMLERVLDDALEKGRTVMEAHLTRMPTFAPGSARRSALEQTGWRTSVGVTYIGGQRQIIQHRGRRIAWDAARGPTTEEALDRLLEVKDAVRAARRELRR